MQIVIEGKDFKRLTESTQNEILALLTGASSQPAAKANGEEVAETAGLRWREPVSLDIEQCQLLTQGMTKKQLDILRAFANKSGRATMKKLLEITGEKDLHGISKFQGLATRHLRRIIKDPHYKAQLFAWDFEKTKWDKGGTNIVSGEYYVADKTAESLRSVLSK
jgi:hypothetical protein